MFFGQVGEAEIEVIKRIDQLSHILDPMAEALSVFDKPRGGEITCEQALMNRFARQHTAL